MAQEFSGLPMEALIGGPLNAAAKANSAMAMTQTKFMLDNCFSIPAKDDKNTDDKNTNTPAINNYAPIMIVMSLTRGVITPGDPKATPPTETSIKEVTTSFNLPLLTIIPLNSLAVETVDINFEMEVKSSFSEEQSESKEKEVKAEASFEAKVGVGIFSASIKGSASYDQKDSSTHNTHYQKSNSAKYTVNVHAGQLPLPKGVNTIIEAFTQSIQPISLN